MLNFKPLKENLQILKKYLNYPHPNFCEYTLNVNFMWTSLFNTSYAEIDDTLILKEHCEDYETAFFYPLGKNVEKGLSVIEEYCIKTDTPLTFCYISKDELEDLKTRYKDVSFYSIRKWSDYIYTAEQFKTYKGKKLSGQRNHVNKFTKTYPQYKFKIYNKEDEERVIDFLREIENSSDLSSSTAKTEEIKLYDFVKNADNLAQVGGYIEIDGKIAGISFGEKVNDTLIIGIEKADKKYDGIYPTLAKEFAIAFATDNIRYINREDDTGDVGLRTSKMQYHPIEVKDKLIVKCKTLFDKIVPPVNIKTDRLTVSEIEEKDGEDYYKLYTDDKNNIYWGYDYREDLNGQVATPGYFYEFKNSLIEKKEEYSLKISLNEKFIGEVVMHNFDYTGGVEVGYRLFPEYQNKGYATEAVKAVIDYAFNDLKADRVKGRCNKLNKPSYNLLMRLNMKKIKEDETNFYFELKK